MDKRKEMDSIDGAKAIDIIELITQLRNERLLVVSELKAIKAANEKVREIIDKLTQAAWLNLQKRIILNTLAIANSKTTTVKCWQNLNVLASTVFVHSKEVLNHHESAKFGELLQILRSKPEALAHLLVAGVGENSLQEEGSSIINCLTSGLYGSLLLPEDVSLILSLLQHLARLELVTADNPRRKLRHKTCAFSQLYFLFHENLPAAKLFLIAALRKPIMHLIARTDNYLDVDPEKALSRVAQKEKNEDVQSYQKKAIEELVQFTTNFIVSIKDSILSFPGSFAWLIGQVSDMMAKTYGLHSKEVHEVNTDLIFTLFICPAIVHPEAYGICDISICDVARHNLTQVAQILQTLALFRFQDLDPKYVDFYSLFERDTVYNIIGDLLKNSTNELSVDHVPEVPRTSVLFTVEELYNMVSYLQKAVNLINVEEDQMEENNKKLPFQIRKKPNSLPSLKQISFLLNTLVAQQTDQSQHSQGKLSHNVNGALSFSSSIISNRSGKAHKSAPKRSTSPNGSGKPKPETVLIIPIQQEKIQRIGLLPEHKVVGIESHDVNDEFHQDSMEEADQAQSVVTSTSGLNSVVGQEKRIRFSRSHDESSVGNTSDNLEAVSEAASNHSVDSSVELENEDQNDNLSDMISANVSGRGTPNISGRDTPSSQVNDGDEGPQEEVAIEVPEPPLPSTQTQIIDKQTQSEIEDKFCKFEIKKMLEGEETRSVISDTWSTDVLASDSETVDGSDVKGEQQNIHFVTEAQLMGPPGGNTPLLDMSETKSESGWSTDVLASDSERLTEVDADDISVARLDDAASIIRSDEGAASADAGSIIVAKGTDQDELLKMNALDLPCCLMAESSSGSMNRTICNCQRCAFEYSVAGTNTSATSATYQSINSFLKDTDASKVQTSTVSSSMQRHQEMDPMQNLNSNLEYNSGSSSSSNSSLESHTKDSQKVEKSDSKGECSSSVGFTPLSENAIDSSPPLSYAAAVTKNASTGGVSALKSTSLNGAIPKSISFDVSAEKGSDDEQKEKRSGFLGKLRLGFRNRRGKTLREAEELAHIPCEKPVPSLRRALSEESPNFSFTGMCDDILAKYRKTVCDNNSVTRMKSTSLKSSRATEQKQEDGPLYQEETDNNLAFSNVKKKLRLVLSNSCGYHSTVRVMGSKQVKSDLESYLQLELAKAYKLKCLSSARIAEVLRCVKLFDEEHCLKLCTILKEDYCQRSVYIQYLIQSRQLLLSILAFLDGLSEQIESERELSTSYMATICVRLFLERHELEMARFCKEFAQLTLVDEKCYSLKEFLSSLYSLIRKDTIWQDDMELAEVAIERAVINEVYHNALYPNGDGDKDRDSVLREHLMKLSKVINPNHKDLMISTWFQHECPWQPAQEALRDMASYHTPRDKVVCVLRCALAIKDLLSLASNKIPTADDFTPILVYVIIKANPPNLLSTIQYVNSFYGDWLQGEDLYWWTQFCAAVEFTKTMDYCD